MSITKILDKISDEYNRFRSKNADHPRYLIADRGTRLAIKLIPNRYGSQTLEPVTFMGMTIIPYEEALIVMEEV